MSMTFTKLFSSITESTVWCEPDRTRLVWITMLAMSDKMGRVWASIPGLANRARVPVEDARVAITTFLSPDPDSRSPEQEGRRIEEMDGGWRLLNHQKYRDLRDDEDRRRQNREAAGRHRKKVSQSKPGVSQSKPESAHADADADADARSKAKTLAHQAAREGFDLFWKSYPRKVAKKPALKTWLKLKPDSVLQKTILLKLEHLKGSQDWTKESGKFIPHPATWLNEERWEDEVSAPPPSPIPSPASTLSDHGRYMQKLINRQLAEQAREAEEKASVPASEDGDRA